MEESRRIVVIADDITGAAEIAGIAFSHSRQVSLVCSSSDIPSASTTVIATDTRSMTEADAVGETRRIGAALKGVPVFKKTDSALRGHVVAELAALLAATGCRRAVYLPANPSKGRIIRDGIYYIKEVAEEGRVARYMPIAETAFSYDPEFPARTSSLKERFPDAEAHHIIMPDAVDADDIRRVIATYDDGKTIFAGAADLFTAILESGRISPATIAVPLSGPSRLILCGSTQSKPLDIGIPTVPMPRTVYDGEQDADAWLAAIPQNLATAPSLILTIPHTHRTGKEVAVHLRTVMAEMAKRLIARHQPDQLIIEGGATAWATLNALGWTQFEIERQVAPGVVQMRAANGTLVTLKPGSYPWGQMFGE